MAYHVASEETLDREGLGQLQRTKLTALLNDVLPSNPFYRSKFDGIDFDPQSDPLDRLPLTTRAEIQQDQLTHPLYGTNLTYPETRYRRLHETSGSAGAPLRWLDTEKSWNWWKHCWAIIYRAANVTQRDRLLVPFSFGPFIGFWGALESALALDNFCLPCGGMTTTARLKHMLAHRATVVCCTPTYALRMAEVAMAEGMDLPSSAVRALIVAGEPGGNIAGTRSLIEKQWGARVFDHVGMTEIGPWGFECAEAPSGVHVMESEFIAEVLVPGSDEPVADGESGELILTNLGRVGSPLIRYRTGDRVALTRQRCACGRWFARAEGGVLGRLDDMLFLRGNNVFPSTIEGILREFAEVAEFRLEVDERDALAQLRIDVEPTADALTGQLAGAIEDAVRDRLHFSPRVTVLDPGSLPRFDMKAQRLTRRTGSRKTSSVATPQPKEEGP